MTNVVAARGRTKESGMEDKHIKRLLEEFTALSRSVERIRSVLLDALGETGSSQIVSLDSRRSLEPEATEPKPSTGGGFMDVFNLAGDIKRVSLAVMRLGTASAEAVAKESGLSVDEARVYLTTLARDGSITRVKQAGGTASLWRAVLKRKVKRGTSSLLDKLG